MNQQNDYNTFQLNELSSIDFNTSLELLEQEYNKLSNSEDLNITFNQISIALQNDENGVREKLNEIRSLTKKIVDISKEYQVFFERLDTIIIELDDLTENIKSESEIIEYSPEKKEILNSKLEKIYSLFRKHNVNKLDDLKIIKERLEKKITDNQSFKEKISKEKYKLDEINSKLVDLSQKITVNRKKVIPVLKKKLNTILNDMGMIYTIFKIELQDSSIFLKNGKDKLSLNFTANKGGPTGPLSKNASGGELSRIMLALKSILSNYKNLPTIIFDEIDTGVSGEIANSIGRIMRGMGKNMQVISITHLPQVAAKANNHFKVFKKVINGDTLTKLKNLSFDERVSEIAEMLSGEQSAERAYDLAKELLN